MPAKKKDVWRKRYVRRAVRCGDERWPGWQEKKLYVPMRIKELREKMAVKRARRMMEEPELLAVRCLWRKEGEEIGVVEALVMVM